MSEQEEWARLNEFFKRAGRAEMPYWRTMWAPKGILYFQSRATRNIFATVGKSNRSTLGPFTTALKLSPSIHKFDDVFICSELSVE